MHDEDSNKVLVSWIVGLLIGGMLVWAFSGPTEPCGKDQTTLTPQATQMTPYEACMDRGGVPIENDYGRLVDCKGI